MTVGFRRDSEMFTHHRCVEVRCSGCGASFDNTHFESLLAAVDALADEQWSVDGAEVLCGRCQQNPEPDSVSGRGRGFIFTECVSLGCAGCDRVYGRDQEPAHFRTHDELVAAALRDENSWSQSGDELFCEHCTAVRACLADGGHFWMDEPSWVRKHAGARLYYCQRCYGSRLVAAEGDSL